MRFLGFYFKAGVSDRNSLKPWEFPYRKPWETKNEGSLKPLWNGQLTDRCLVPRPWHAEIRAQGHLPLDGSLPNVQVSDGLNLKEVS